MRSRAKCEHKCFVYGSDDLDEKFARRLAFISVVGNFNYTNMKTFSLYRMPIVLSMYYQVKLTKTAAEKSSDNGGVSFQKSDFYIPFLLLRQLRIG